MGDPGRGPERSGGLAVWSGTCPGTLQDVWDGSGDNRGGPGRVGGPSWRLGTGRGNPPKGSGQLIGPSKKYRTGRGIIGEARNG